MRIEALQSEILSGREVLPSGSRSASARALVFMLHGVGSSGDDLIGLAEHYRHFIGDGLAYLSPHAPFGFDMAEMAGAYQWFSLRDNDMARWARELGEVYPIFRSFVDEQLSRFGVSSEAVIFLGFSQGTMLSLYASLMYGGRLGGVVGYSGALLGAEDRVAGEGDLPPYLLMHGADDPVVPAEASRLARDFLQSQGGDVELEIYPDLPHSISSEGIVRGAEFIKAKLNL